MTPGNGQGSVLDRVARVGLPEGGTESWDMDNEMEAGEDHHLRSSQGLGSFSNCNRMSLNDLKQGKDRIWATLSWLLCRKVGATKGSRMETGRPVKRPLHSRHKRSLWLGLEVSDSDRPRRTECCGEDKRQIFIYYKLQEDKNQARESCLLVVTWESVHFRKWNFLKDACHMFIFSNHTFKKLKSLLFKNEELQNFSASNTFFSSHLNLFFL